MEPGFAFLSTLSLRRATNRGPYHVKRHEDFYPRSPCGERLVAPLLATGSPRISIHALLAESDFFLDFGVSFICIFLSTLSLRRATNRRPLRNGHYPHFYPRSPCGERQLNIRQIQKIENISIHALLAESDNVRNPTTTLPSIFLSTLSLRRATRRTYQQGEEQAFLSTLSLRRATALCKKIWLL